MFGFSTLTQNIYQKWFNVQRQTVEGVQLMQLALFRGGIIFISSIVTIWISIFLYTAFYYSYMPNMLYTRPVHLGFQTCSKEGKGMCSYPSAYEQLTKKQQLLMVGQPYKINLHLEMPESPANKELGMFMVCGKLFRRNNNFMDESCRPTMLHYRSKLLHFLSTFTSFPILFFGTQEEKQTIVVELFSNFIDDQDYPVTGLHVEIQSRQIEFYSASVSIQAHLSGLRYLMFHWPIFSAVIGIGSNLFFIALICILSYLHFTHESDLHDGQFNYEKGELEDSHKNNTDLSSESSSIEDASMLEDVMKSKEELTDSELNLFHNKSSFIEELQSDQ
ncbi:seipin [Chelonus insularis]|uniref:seipin n=1 Tax=Chelonus insularis TaxID=460826 RepID=UPI00158CD793|nr:seipin [Chelonus insularis]